MAEINVFKHAEDTLSLEADELLFREGDDGDVMFAVIEGSIDLHVDGTLVESVGPGGILGEMALIDPGPRSATAVVRAPARVARVDRQHFVFLVQEHPTFALQVMAVMAQRLRRANQNA